MVVAPPGRKKKLLEDITVWSVVLSLIAIFCSICVLRFQEITKPNENPCIMDNPPVVVSGKILPEWGNPHNHYLWYKGKRKMTGEECKTRRRVTEKEYERRMYGH